MGANTFALCCLSFNLSDMDVFNAAGTFAPNFTIGPPVVAALRKHTGMFLDCHLAVSVGYSHFNIAGNGVIMLDQALCSDDEAPCSESSLACNIFLTWAFPSVSIRFVANSVTSVPPAKNL